MTAVRLDVACVRVSFVSVKVLFCKIHGHAESMSERVRTVPEEASESFNRTDFHNKCQGGAVVTAAALLNFCKTVALDIYLS